MNNKKGLSDVVATVLIILLALAAVAIVWRFVSPTIGGVGTTSSLQSKCFTIDVEPVTCVIVPPGGGLQTTNDDIDVSYRMKKGDAESIDSITVIVETNTNAKYTGSGTIGELLQTSTVRVTTPGAENPVNAKVAVVVKDNKGNTATCNPSTKLVTCSLASSTSVCGNDNPEPGEFCDDGDGVAAECPYNLNSPQCSDCNSPADGSGDCLFGQPLPNGCGDGDMGASGSPEDTAEQCDDGNTSNGDGCSSTCQTEVAVVCGDGIVSSPTEECDPGTGSPLPQCGSGVGVPGPLGGICASTGPNACICL